MNMCARRPTTLNNKNRKRCKVEKTVNVGEPDEMVSQFYVYFNTNM